MSRLSAVVPDSCELGLATHLTLGDYEQAADLLESLVGLEVGNLRLRLSGAWSEEARRWSDWLLASIDEDNAVVAAPDAPATAFALAHHFGHRLEALELPAAALGTLRRLRDRGHSVIAALCPDGFERELAALKRGGLLPRLHALTLELYPETRDRWPGWSETLGPVHVAAGDPDSRRTPLWLTTAHSTWGRGDRAQVESFADAVAAAPARLYWQGLKDGTAPALAAHDPRRGQTGLMDPQGRPKLLLRLLRQGGAEAVRSLVQATRRPSPVGSSEPVALITGGAGFVGANVADRLLGQGRRVVLFDNLSRPGTERNLKWLLERHPERLEFQLGDIRDPAAVHEAVARADQVYHFAAQVAVTTSLEEPTDDFEANGRGTLNLLEAIRARDDRPSLLFTSTNKVYGGLDDVPLCCTGGHYEPRDGAIRARGIDESRALEFCSPYGCSKGSADQYVLDYARTFGLPAAVFRMSCIYGPRQFGNEDQGWVAHFLIRALRGKPITVYGDGLQVRDVLFVDDLVEAMLTAQQQMPTLAGHAFNIGGGPANTLSLRQLLTRIEQLHGKAPEVHHRPWRASDQRYYVSDVGKFRRMTGWEPRTTVEEGVTRLYGWLADEHGIDLAEHRRIAL